MVNPIVKLFKGAVNWQEDFGIKGVKDIYFTIIFANHSDKDIKVIDVDSVLNSKEVQRGSVSKRATKLILISRSRAVSNCLKNSNRVTCSLRGSVKGVNHLILKRDGLGKLVTKVGIGSLSGKRVNLIYIIVYRSFCSRISLNSANFLRLLVNIDWSGNVIFWPIISVKGDKINSISPVVLNAIIVDGGYLHLRAVVKNSINVGVEVVKIDEAGRIEPSIIIIFITDWSVRKSVDIVDRSKDLLFCRVRVIYNSSVGVKEGDIFTNEVGKVVAWFFVISVSSNVLIIS